MCKEIDVDVAQRIRVGIARFVRAETVRNLAEADAAIARAIAANKVAVAARVSLQSAQSTDAAYFGTEAQITAKLACDECLAARRAFNAAVHALAVEKKIVAALAALETVERL
jgi:hypothetical protein